MTSILKQYFITDAFSVVLYKDGSIVARVGDEDVIQCRHALLTTTVCDDEIQSVNQIINKSRYKKKRVIIEKETEFIAHASNLQAWHEYDYDPLLCHSLIAFPLLEALAKLGEMKALKKYVSMYAERWIDGDDNSRTVLVELFMDFIQDMAYKLNISFSIIQFLHDTNPLITINLIKHVISNNAYTTLEDFPEDIQIWILILIVKGIIPQEYFNKPNIYVYHGSYYSIFASEKERFQNMDDITLELAIYHHREIYRNQFHLAEIEIYREQSLINQLEAIRHVEKSLNSFGYLETIISDESDYPSFLFSKGKFTEFKERKRLQYNTRPENTESYFLLRDGYLTSRMENWEKEQHRIKLEFQEKFPFLKRYKRYISYRKAVIRFKDGHYETCIIIDQD